jgi:hypothetical protein
MAVNAECSVSRRLSARKAYPLGWRKLLLACGVVSSVLYVAVDLLASLRWYAGYSYRDQEFSELFAQGSPVRDRMILLNGFPYLALVLAFALGVWFAAGPKRAARFTAAMLVGYAVLGFIGGVVTPMSTREALAAGEKTLSTSLHPVMTALMSLCVLLAIGVGARLVGNHFRWYSYGTMLMMVVFGVSTFPYVSRMVANEPTPWMGVIERVNIYGIMLWVVALAACLWRALGGQGGAPLELPICVTDKTHEARRRPRRERAPAPRPSQVPPFPAR